jgi:glutathione synthase
LPLHIAIQMDPIESINVKRDTTYVLGLEAQKRGHMLYYYQPHQLFLTNGAVMAELTELTLHPSKEHHFDLGNTSIRDMSQMDVVLMRQDPPFDMNYLTYTYLLEKLHPKTLIVNNPKEVRNCPEKIFACHFPHLMPPTIITGSLTQGEDFFQKHNPVILKPLYAFGGKNIYLAETIEQFREKYRLLLNQYNAPVMIQKFLPNISKGDKRIILIDGEIAGALNRIPKDNDYISNMAQGGTAIKTEITDREKTICDTLKPELKRRGIILAGIDIIDGFLTEINVTSPTGLKVINELYKLQLEIKFWDVVEEKYQNRKPASYL